METDVTEKTTIIGNGGVWGDQEDVRVGEGAGHVLPGQNILDRRETSTKSLGKEV